MDRFLDKNRWHGMDDFLNKQKRDFEKTVKSLESERDLLIKRASGQLEGFVYFIADLDFVGTGKTRGLYKIGKSINPQFRLKNLTTASGRNLKLIGKIFTDDCKELEKRMHSSFGLSPHKRIRGEWFEIDKTCDAFWEFVKMDELRLIEDFEFELETLNVNIANYKWFIKTITYRTFNCARFEEFKITQEEIKKQFLEWNQVQEVL